MDILTNEYKKLHYIVNSLVIPWIRSEYPQWLALITAYLKYLDMNALSKALSITNNTNAETIFTELLDDFLNLYFKDVIDLNKFGLNDDNKRLFISLARLLHNLKSTETSFGMFFGSFSNFSIPTDSGDINVNDLVVELLEDEDWWYLNNDPTRPFTYIFKINEVELTNLKLLIKEEHPAGWIQLFQYEVSFEDYIDGNEILELISRYLLRYDGKYTYNGIMIVDGVPLPLTYSGEYQVVETL